MGSMCFWSYTFTEHGDRPPTLPKKSVRPKGHRIKDVNFKSLFRKQSKQRKKQENNLVLNCNTKNERSKSAFQKEKSVKRNSLKVYITSDLTLYKVFARCSHKYTQMSKCT